MTLIVIALGGNAFQSKGDRGSVEEYWRNAENCAESIVKIIEEGYSVVLTHGNGPQVGVIAEWMVLGRERGLEVMTLDIAVAMTQGWLGYLLQRSIYNKLVERGLLGSVVKGVVTLVTQTLVDRNDEAFKDPTKFIGPWYEKEEDIASYASKYGWVYKRDPRGGFRRVVASPKPMSHVEIDAVLKLANEGFVVIASGGGGIPVYLDGKGCLRGVEAVVDKDLAGEILAHRLGADIYMILTDVEKVYINYGKEGQRQIDEVKVSEALRLYREGHFPPGSMGPKVLACINFVKNGGKAAVIAHLSKAYEALKRKTGTWFLPD